MAAFTEFSTRRVPSPWGVEVKRRLLERSIKQEDLVTYLRNRGFNIDKVGLSNLLYGSGTGSRQSEIEAISRFLDIPYQSRASV